MKRTIATAINCIDGRTQIPVIEYMKTTYNVDYVDMITAGGVNKILAEGNTTAQESIKNGLEISVKTNGSKLVAVVGHFDCRGNLEAKEDQLKHIRQALEVVASWEFNVTLIGLWVDSDWKVSELL